MRLMLVLATTLIAVLALPSSMPWTAAQENDYLVVPGQRLGRFRLGVPVDSYGLGAPAAKRQVPFDGEPFATWYSFPSANIWVFTCNADRLTFALLAVLNPVGASAAQSEARKYKTGDGLTIGSGESEVRQILGPPTYTWQQTHTFGSIQVHVDSYLYKTGLQFFIDRAERRVHGLGTTTEGSYGKCEDAVLGGTPPYLSKFAATWGWVLPNNVRIVRPAAGVAAEVAGLSGAWFGRTELGDPLLLIVERIVPPPVVAILGIRPRGRTFGPFRMSGSLAGAELILDVGVEYRFRLLNNNTLDGHYDNPNRGSVSLRLDRIKADPK